ncbi:MAG: hypothetical protein M3290_08235 [Actinomycetota bacterium]|nr:hypothetical protein [Actinomycetota bacterium]
MASRSMPDDVAGRVLDELQRRVLLEVASGAPGKVVARRTAVSESTMRRVLRSVRTTLGANSTINAVYIAAKGGLI